MSRSGSFSSLIEVFRPNNPTRLRTRDLSRRRLEVLKKEIDTNDHMIPLKDLYQSLNTSPETGLSHAQAANLLEYYGTNSLTPPTKSILKMFAKTIFIASLCLIAYTIDTFYNAKPSKDNLYLGGSLIVCVFVSGLFTFYQEYSSTKIMDSFTKMIPEYALVICDGHVYTDINVKFIVKGDIVEVKAGDKIPADIRVIQSKNFQVDNSTLTGESEPVQRSNCEGSTTVLESKNVAFFSTNCVEGWARGVVIACGDYTAIGRVAGLTARLEPDKTPLRREIHRFMRLISMWAFFLGTAFAIASFVLGYNFVDTIVFVIGIIVANVPGLQPTVTASLTLTAQKMAAKNCVVKNLEAVESLGCTTVICSDKTGTLTQNLMKVVHLFYSDKYWEVSPSGIKATLSSSTYKDGTFKKLCRAGKLCSVAVWVTNDAGKTKKVHGDASEAAILTFLDHYVGGVMEARQNNLKVAEIPFNSTNKYQLSIHQNPDKKTNFIVMKGAPEQIIERCVKVWMVGSTVDLTAELRVKYEKSCVEFGKSGERVLAFCELELGPEFPCAFDFNTDEINFPLTGFTLLGLMAMVDPPRENVLEAVDVCRNAGIRVIMVTGDHPITAEAIAKQVGIIKDSATAKIITGSELRSMPSEVLLNNLTKYNEIVFARTSPTQKLQIVEACQKLGHIVAVIGDGVNDSPALKKADIGISMGITGSQVSKQTADIILLDDNFATIVTGIEEGRKIFDNLKKCIAYILASNLPEILPIIMFICAAIPLPLGAVTILCIDLGTDVWPAISLAYEKAEMDIMNRPPRKQNKDKLVTSRMIYLAYLQTGFCEAAAGLYCYFIMMAQYGFYPAILFGIRHEWDNPLVDNLMDSYGQEWTYQERKVVESAAQTAFFVAIVVTQWVGVIICKTRFNSIIQQGMTNWVLNVGLVFETLVACLVIYTPGASQVLKTYPVGFMCWLLPIPFGIFMFLYDELRRYHIRHNLGGFLYRETYY